MPPARFASLIRVANLCVCKLKKWAKSESESERKRGRKSGRWRWVKKWEKKWNITMGEKMWVKLREKARARKCEKVRKSERENVWVKVRERAREKGEEKQMRKQMENREKNARERKCKKMREKKMQKKCKKKLKKETRPPGIEPRTSHLWSTRDNHSATESVTILRKLQLSVAFWQYYKHGIATKLGTLLEHVMDCLHAKFQTKRDFARGVKADNIFSANVHTQINTHTHTDGIVRLV